MSAGVLVRALALLALAWGVLLGPRAAPLALAQRDVAALPRAVLLVTGDGCDSDDHDGRLWQCASTGTLGGGGAADGRQAALAYRASGEAGPDRRHEPGSQVDVVVVRAWPGAGIRLFEAASVADDVGRELRWLARQPLIALAVTGAAWLLLVVVPARVRRRPGDGVLELATWPGLPAVALALTGTVAALASAWLAPLPVVVASGTLLLLLVPVPLALVRTFVEIDRRSGELREGHAVGPWRQTSRARPFSQVAEVRLHDAPAADGTPWGRRSRLVLGGLGGTWDVAVGRAQRMRRLGTDVAAWFGVPLRLPHEPSGIPATLGAPGDEWEEGVPPGEWTDDDPPLAAPTDDAAVPTPGARARGRLARLPSRLLGVSLIGLALFGVAIARAGGIDPFTARLLQPEVESWPAGPAIRRAAVAVVAWRPRHPETAALLGRLAHTLAPGHDLWQPVMRAAARVLGVPLDAATPGPALARLDAALAQALGRPLGPLGVLGWWDRHEYWVMWLDDLSGDDEALAVERFNRLRPPDGLPTSEWVLVQIGAALHDARLVPFAVVAEETGDGWRPRAVSRAWAGAAPRIDVVTVGEAVAVLLAAYPEFRTSEPPADVAAWWTPLAAARGLPAVASRPPAPRNGD